MIETNKKHKWLTNLFYLALVVATVFCGYIGYLYYMVHNVVDASKEERGDILKTLAFLHICRLNEVDLQGVNLQKAKLAGVKLKQANMQLVNLQEASLEGADLEGTILLQANLQSTNLRQANLYKVDLQYSNLKDANLENANLENAYLQNCKNLSIEQICKANAIKNIKGLSKEFLQKIKDKTKDRPNFMAWWDGKSQKDKK